MYADVVKEVKNGCSNCQPIDPFCRQTVVVLCHICSKQGASVYILNSLLVHWVHYEYCIIGNIWLLSLYIVILNSMNFCVERCSGSIKRTWFMCFYEYDIYVWLCFYVSNLFGIVRRHERRGRIASIFRFRRSSRILGTWVGPSETHILVNPFHA